MAPVIAPDRGRKTFPTAHAAPNHWFSAGAPEKTVRGKSFRRKTTPSVLPFARRHGVGCASVARRLRVVHASFAVFSGVLMRKGQSLSPARAIEGRLFPLFSKAMRPTVDVHNLLISLAWLGELRTDQVHRLWLGGCDLRSSQRLLRDLREEGYVERRMWSRWIAGRTTPVRQDALWSVTRKGRDLIREHEQYPPEYKEPRARRMAVHDSTTSEAIVRIIELGREVEHNGQRGLSGLYVEREVRLDPTRTRPVMDALIIVTVGGGFDRSDLIPWSRDPTLEGERRVRYALENDRDTEPPTVIAAKALHYQHAGTPAWERRYGRFPLPMWLVPSLRRLEQVLLLWRQAWPIGKWVITTDRWLESDYWLEFDRGVVTERSLFYTTPLRRPRLDPEEQDRLNRMLTRR